MSFFDFFVGLEPNIVQQFDRLEQDEFQDMSGSDRPLSGKAGSSDQNVVL
jgi:hypothetical protein